MDGMDRETGEIVAMEPIGIPPVIAAAIIAVKKRVKQLGADDRNEHGRYNFVSVDKFYATIGKLMADAGLALLIDETGHDLRPSDKSGNIWLFANYACRFVHESGAMGPPMRRAIALPISGPQAFGAAQSYIEKQLLRQVFKVPTGEKDADDTAPGENAPGRTLTATQVNRRPLPSPAAPENALKQDALKRHNEIRDAINAAMTPADARSWDGCPAWALMEAALRKAETEEVAQMLIDKLRERIGKRVAMLEEQGHEERY